MSLRKKTARDRVDAESRNDQAGEPQDATRPDTFPREWTVNTVSRRSFLGGLAASAGTLGAGAITLSSSASAAYSDPMSPGVRQRQAYRARLWAAKTQAELPYPAHACNGDETRYADFRNQFSKGLPHNALGEVDPAAYNALLTAIGSGRFADYEAVPLAGARKLACPLGALSFEMVGPDSHHVTIPAAPSFDSAWQAGEMVEVYWKALLRDLRFEDYGADAKAAAAAAELSRLSDFRGPKVTGRVTPDTLFRGFTAGDLVGPYISQFLWGDVPFGATVISQKYEGIAAGDDRGVTYADWLDIQNGNVPGSPTSLPGPTRYIVTGRDLAQYVHFDFSYQAYLNAGLMLLSLGSAAFASNNPYKTSAKQGAFVNFGGPEVLDLVAKASGCALKAAWFQKWGVHRRSRPEDFAGRVHNEKTARRAYGIHPEVLDSAAAAATYSRHGTYLLPLAYPEGSPTHCSYPAGHAVIAGACVTILKAFFDEDFVLPAPVVPSSDGSTLQPYTGASLTIGGELDKLASNISIGRNIAGVHWRTDGDCGMRLGEELAIGILRDYRKTRPEPISNVTFTSFDGRPMSI
ncbi:MAG: vanadium-dependent haloperoxidase [Planctomycetota bacterium]|nr:vanadium-dependent haloperoxidase [Planctomycetota bacterium]